MATKVVCDYCGEEAELVSGEVIYPNREDLHDYKYWYCKDCNAYVGCYDDGVTPKGSLADEELRPIRRDLHKAFNELWESGKFTRKAAYNWLSQEMGLDRGCCHIGKFDLDKCRHALKIIKGFKSEFGLGTKSSPKVGMLERNFKIILEKLGAIQDDLSELKIASGIEIKKEVAEEDIPF